MKHFQSVFQIDRRVKTTTGKHKSGIRKLAIPSLALVAVCLLSTINAAALYCEKAGIKCLSPIIVDTDARGFHLTSAEGGVMFDMMADGHPMQVSWTAPGSTNAFLALPHNGKITNGKELFGDFTPQPPSNDPNGFLALAVYDRPERGGNGDGVIDARDAVFSSLRLWIDRNHDGIAQPDEIYTLPELGVFSIALHYTEAWKADRYGNLFRYKGKINATEDEDGSKADHVIYDVFFRALDDDSDQ